MMARRKLLIALLCPLFIVATVMLVQGCRGGGQTEQAEETAKETETVEESKPAMEPHEEQLHLAGYVCPMHPDETSLEPGKCGACGMELKEAKVHYTCTHCGGSFAKAGKCACGMDLVLRAAGEEEAGGAHAY